VTAVSRLSWHGRGTLLAACGLGERVICHCETSTFLVLSSSKELYRLLLDLTKSRSSSASRASSGNSSEISRMVLILPDMAVTSTENLALCLWRLLVEKVRRARFGPGLWPGPRRQARWVGRGLQGQRRAAGASRAGGMRSTVEAGGADPDNARRSGPSL
jgi:hypothetical protein